MSSRAESLSTTNAPLAFDVHRIRKDFPILDQRINGKPLSYLDNGATTQKPRSVIDAVADYYRHSNANVQRGVHTLSERATQAYEGARDKTKTFINAADKREIIFLRGTTEAINLVAQGFARPRLKAGDEIIVTEMEHHSNIVPWQMVCQQTGAVLRVAPINDAGELKYEEFLNLFNPRTCLLAITHLSNALGTLIPVKEMIKAAHAQNVPVIVDGAQAVAREGVDVRDLDCDFYAFSGHKVYGPTGIGVLYGKLAHLQEMEPYQGGGEMIRRVTFEQTLYAEPPYKFEAGTPNIAGAIGLGEAMDYVTGIGLDEIGAHEHDLLNYATERVVELPGVRLIGTARHKSGILSFVMEGVHPHDIGTIMDHEGVAIRAGHLCAMPVMQYFGVPALARASFGMYNTRREVDALISAMQKVFEVMRR
ncbi:MAG: cysteine desulfurase [Gammaproteobacteria bacterium]|nr:cysteine desulfurase [Gammaproteobacteria bacterium]